MISQFHSRILQIVMALTVIGLLSSCLRGGKIESITVTPAQAIIAAGATQQYTATAIFSDGTTLNWTSAVSWQSDNSAVTISNAVGSNGLATAINTSVTGTITITATDTVNNITSSATLSITDIPLSQIVVVPQNQVVSLAATPTLQYIATGLYGDSQTTQDITPYVIWTSSNPAVATISNAGGSNGVVTIVATGSTTITARDPITNNSSYTTLEVGP